ncbi:MAG: BrnA antitoxin family protein [Acidobacteria bacterium]|nr:BrnA antitoxin family protein [Acidobacteriota bacterium]
MPKKSSTSNQPGKPVSVSAEAIWRKPLTKRQKETSESDAARQKLGDDSSIDYSSIPELSDKQLKQFKRPAKKLVAVRLDADVFEWLQGFGAGYSTRINHVLRTVMLQSR